jgi:outer membrane protein insertion porin family
LVRRSAISPPPQSKGRERVVSRRYNGCVSRLVPALLVGTVLGGMPSLAQAPSAPAAAAPSPAPGAGAPAVEGVIRSIDVVGSQRLEPDTVRSYIKLRPGQTFTAELLDDALRELLATELFADVQVRNDNGAITIQVKESPVINRIVLEGNKRLKEDKIRPEIKLAPRQIFTRSKARADVARIVELYRRQGRFAATVEPKMVTLDQNRVDIVFEINEGPKSKVRRINIIGNEKFSDGELRGEMATKETGLTKIFSSGTSYDPDKLAYDQQKMRQFYLTNGYADFRVISAVAELTPDKRDFIITYVVEEGDRYKFANVDIDSEIRDLKADTLRPFVPVKSGDWYNAKTIEDTVERLNETAGALGYAFADVRPEFVRKKEDLTMAVTFKVADAPRVYVERIDINGNTHTKDKVVRREMRLAEGDAFNSFRVKRSADRIKSLGFFQENLEIEQKQGSAPDRVILEANLEEKSTGELQVSAGFSSLEKFIVDLSIKERNFMGKGQEVRAGVNYSTYSKSVELGFTEPYIFDKNIAVGFDVFRRDYNSFNYINDDRETTYEQTTTGFQIRSGVSLTEFWSLALRYGLSFDDVSLDKDRFFIGDQCSPLLAGRYLCDAIGKRTTSSVGYSLVYDNLNNRIRPSRGERIVFSQDFAGLGGSVKYLRSRIDSDKYFGIGGGFIFSVGLEGGAILPLEKGRGDGVDAVRLTDRFFLGEPQVRGFDIRGIGPRVQRAYYPRTSATPAGPDLNASPDFSDPLSDDALGGRYYYVGRAELEIPLGSGAKELGLRPSLFADVGSVFGIKNPTLGTTTSDTFIPTLEDGNNFCVSNATTTSTTTTVPAGTDCPTGSTKLGSTINAFQERFVGDTWKPRLSVGFGVNWNSPFGPFRIDIAKALLKREGDETKLFSFNVGTQF